MYLTRNDLFQPFFEGLSTLLHKSDWKTNAAISRTLNLLMKSWEQYQNLCLVDGLSFLYPYIFQSHCREGTTQQRLGSIKMRGASLSGPHPFIGIPFYCKEVTMLLLQHDGV